MTLIKVKMIEVQKPRPCFTVDLPTWQGRQFDTDEGKKPPAAKAIVEVPATFIDINGKLDRKFIKATYKGSKWEKHIDEVDDPEVVIT